MDRKATDSIVTAIGTDISKNTFHLVLRQKLSRGQVAARLAKMALPHGSPLSRPVLTVCSLRERGTSRHRWAFSTPVEPLSPRVCSCCP
jgi:hypothetical protein